uniref:Putative salivary lipocalin n=1 Tax=Ixodes ricinus TaxID=34613 RepID=A0A147BFI8_IXORI
MLRSLALALVSIQLCHAGGGLNSVKKVLDFYETRPDLGKYQNGWRVLTSHKKMVLLYSLFSIDDTFGNNIACVSMKRMRKNTQHKWVEELVSFQPGVQTNPINITLYLGAKSHRRYKYPNIIYSLNNAGTKPYLASIAYTDYMTCVLIRVLRFHNGREGCQLWADAKHVNRVPDYCHFAYSLLCGTIKYHVYNERKCKA